MNDKIILKNLKKLSKKRNISMTALAVKLEIANETISRYNNGSIEPKLSTVIKMAKILDTSVDYLLGLTNDPNPKDFVYSERESDLIHNYRKLTDREKLQTEMYIQVLVDSKEYINN